MVVKEGAPFENSKLAETRRKAARLLCRYLPANIADEHGGMEAAGEHVAQKRGLLIVLNHFSYRDGAGAFMYVAGRSDQMLGKQWLAPVARHISDVAGLLNRIFRVEVDLKPIVTPSTMLNRKYKHLHRAEGLPEYIKAATSTLDEGGIVVLFPQSTRMPYLSAPGPDDKAMELLMNRTTRADVNDFGVLPVGLGLPGIEDYSAAKRFNFGKPYDVHIGPLWQKKDILSNAERLGQSLDTWVTEQLRPLVPLNYLALPTSGDIFTRSI